MLVVSLLRLEFIDMPIVECYKMECVIDYMRMQNGTVGQCKSPTCRHRAALGFLWGCYLSLAD